uniref:Uncharacterized protein n=1 Tax=Neospora caninum (strain Liverpool) TaxID=572307 RepID=A0A0F7U3K9_NEOCL|nr:TPA: hypothetical protein BN1204_002507 [Neospora caninum Liverpool]
MALFHYLARGVCTPRLMGKQTRGFFTGRVDSCFKTHSTPSLRCLIAPTNALSSPSLRLFQSAGMPTVRVSGDSQGLVSSSRSFSTTSGQVSSAVTNDKGGHEPHNAYPETPLHFYRATPYSEGSINHRFFYINLIFLLFVYDVGSAMVDL